MRSPGLRACATRCTFLALLLIVCYWALEALVHVLFQGQAPGSALLPDDGNEIRMRLTTAAVIAGAVVLTTYLQFRRRVTEAELEATRHRSELLLQSAPEGILGLDGEGRHVFVNPAAERLLGFSASELIGRESHPKWHHSRPDGTPYPREECPILHPSPQGLPHGNDREVFWRKDGTPFPVEYTATPLLDDGRPVGAVVTFRDISDRRLAEDRLRESEARYRSITESATDAIISSDQEGRIVSWNHAAENIFGYMASETQGQSIALIMPEGFRKQHMEAMARFLRTGEAAFPGRVASLLGRRKDGSEFPVEISLARWEQKGQAYFTAILRDVSEVAALRGEAARATRLEDLGRITAGVAHEVRNPLQAIVGAAAALQRSEGYTAEDQELLGMIHGHAERIAEFMKDLVEMVQPLDPASFAVRDLGALVRDAVAQWRSLRGTASEVRLALPGGPLPVRAHADKIARVVESLLDNAAQHGGPGGAVAVDVERSGDRVRLNVSDVGPGAAQEALDRAFEPFFTMKRGGTGLGLSLVLHLVEQHGGSAALHNRTPPPGCTAEVLLPLAGDPSGLAPG